MIFSWDEEKNNINQQKHGLSFQEAAQLFLTSGYTIEYDSEHSTLEEDRYLARGRLDPHGFIIIVFVEIIDDEVRIISARKDLSSPRR